MFDHCHFRDIQFNPSGPDFAGLAIVAFGGPVDVRNSTFEEIGRVGVLAFGSGLSGSVIEGNTYIGKGEGEWLDSAFEISAGAQVSLLNNELTGCQGITTADGSQSASISMATFFGPGTMAEITGNTIRGNRSGLVIGFGTDTSVASVSFNRIVGNTNGLAGSSTLVTAENNWWGCNAGPGSAGCDTVIGSGNHDFDPWLLLQLTAGPDTIFTGESATLTADLRGNSDSEDTSALGNLPDQTATLFAAGTLGGVLPALTSTTGGTASSVYTAGPVAGNDTASVTVVVPADPLSAAVWFSAEPGASFGDVQGHSVEGQAAEVLFQDGFETGDESRWSQTVP